MHRFLLSVSIESWPLYRWQGPVSTEPDCRFFKVSLLFCFLSVQHEQAPIGRMLEAELSAWQARSTGPGSSGPDQLS